MGYTQQDEWHDHYARGEKFRALTDAERAALSTALRPQGLAVALDVGCGSGCFSKDGVPRRSCRFTPGPSF